MSASGAHEDEGEIELAELQQALLDDATLDALLGDVDTLCTIEAITFKSSAEAYADAVERASIAAVRPALADGVAVQLRYSYRGERWCDTLLPGMTETLLVRIREPMLPR
jgi:hypothetical protein